MLLAWNVLSSPHSPQSLDKSEAPGVQLKPEKGFTHGRVTAKMRLGLVHESWLESNCGANLKELLSAKQVVGLCLGPQSFQKLPGSAKFQSVPRGQQAAGTGGLNHV